MTTIPWQATRHAGGEPGCPDPESFAVYIDGRASAAETAILEAHLAQCDDCFFVFSETTRQHLTDGSKKKTH